MTQRIHQLMRTYHIDMGKNKAGCDNDDGEGDKEADGEEEDVVADAFLTVPGWTAAGNKIR